MTKKVHNLQDKFLMEYKHQKKLVTVFLLNGVPIKGHIIGFDQFTILIGDERKQSIIYKHAISTII